MVINFTISSLYLSELSSHNKFSGHNLDEKIAEMDDKHQALKWNVHLWNFTQNTVNFRD